MIAKWKEEYNEKENSENRKKMDCIYFGSGNGCFCAGDISTFGGSNGESGGKGNAEESGA